MNRYRTLILDFATKAHAGQIRKNTGAPYITHPIAVAEIALAKVKDRHIRYQEMIYAIAINHDVLEDTNATIEELEAVFKDAGFSLSEISLIMYCIKILTKSEKDFDIIEYIHRIKYQELARIVKLADLEHNMSDLKPGNLLDKYKLCVLFLTRDEI